VTKRQYITAIIKDKHGRALSVGHNNYVKTHTMMKLHGQKVGIPFKEYLHAEVAAIVKCKNLHNAYSIHVYRYSKEGAPMIAKPCPICESVIKSAGIKHIYFTVHGE